MLSAEAEEEPQTWAKGHCNVLLQLEFPEGVTSLDVLLSQSCPQAHMVCPHFAETGDAPKGHCL